MKFIISNTTILKRATVSIMPLQKNVQHKDAINSVAASILNGFIIIRVFQVILT